MNEDDVKEKEVEFSDGDRSSEFENINNDELLKKDDLADILEGLLNDNNEKQKELLETIQTLDEDETNSVVELLTEINEHLDVIEHETAVMSGTVQVYGLVVVPFFFVCLMLWWFFKQFLYRY